MEILKSRTIQTLLVILVINLVNAYSTLIPAEIMIGLNVLLPLLAGYFRINPKQTFTNEVPQT